MTESASTMAWRTGQYWVSPLNAAPAVQDTYAFPDPLVIYDSTVRKILYTPGLRPPVDKLLRVCSALEEVGVREIILCVNSWGDATPERVEHQVAREILSRGFAFRTTVLADSLLPSRVDGTGHFPNSAVEAVSMLGDIGARTIAVLLRVLTDPNARARQLERLTEVLAYGRSLEMTCVVGLPDVGRMPLQDAVGLANEAIGLGAARIDLVDSFSSLSPEAMKLFIRTFRDQLVTAVPVTMHAHDDFGLGTACAIAAASAGAHPDVSVNGLSYRSGFAALEEVALSLEVLYGVKTNLRLDRLRWLGDVVAECAGLPTPPLKAITGAHAFMADNPGWVTRYLENGADGFPPPATCFKPSMVGGQTQAVWGHHHSIGVLEAKLRQMGIVATNEQVTAIRRQIEVRVDALETYPRWLTEAEVEKICKATVP